MLTFGLVSAAVIYDYRIFCGIEAAPFWTYLAMAEVEIFIAGLDYGKLNF